MSVSIEFTKQNKKKTKNKYIKLLRHHQEVETWHILTILGSRGMEFAQATQSDITKRKDYVNIYFVFGCTHIGKSHDVNWIEHLTLYIHKYINIDTHMHRQN